MTQLEKAFYPPSCTRVAVRDAMLAYDKDRATTLKMLGLPDTAKREEVEANLTALVIMATYSGETWRNDLYQVNVRKQEPPDHGWPEMYWLSIKRNDRQPIHDWRDLQEIKNQILGTEAEAVELYPAESRRVDSANQYHLFGIKAPGMFPFGFNERYVVDQVEGSVAQQRPL